MNVQEDIQNRSMTVYYLSTTQFGENYTLPSMTNGPKPLMYIFKKIITYHQINFHGKLVLNYYYAAKQKQISLFKDQEIIYFPFY